VDKVAEYAHEGIPVYLVVHLDADCHMKFIQEHRLDRAGSTYRMIAPHQDTLFLNDPFTVVIPFADLDAVERKERMWAFQLEDVDESLQIFRDIDFE